jgi:hypothetical protein
MIFSKFARKYFCSLFISLSCGSACFAQSQFIEVDYTPYDHQMERIQPVLAAAAGYSLDQLSLTLVNEWMIELRAMPYHYSREWRTPFEVERTRAGDCKGKALALYDRMLLNGACNLRFVIGKRRANDLVTHAWLEWDLATGTLILDPTFNWTATWKLTDRRGYVALYGYEGARKFAAANVLFAKNSFARRAPVAPAQGAITRPTRSPLRSSPSLFDEGPVDWRFFPNRPTL